MALPKSVLLIVTGSVASYKALELVRLLKAEGTEVTAILTRGAKQFITPLAVSSLTGTKTYDELFSLTDEVEMGHIELSRLAELVLVAPASADILAKMAAGLADDLATTALLATASPVVVAPAMNHKMWSHAATRRNIAQLKKDGIAVIEPTEGDMACGEHGIGRMAEPKDIVEFLSHQPPVTSHPRGRIVNFSGDWRPETGDSLKGKRAIVTSGPTQEAIDPVRYLGNRSSGKQGHAIAEALAAAGAEVTLVTGSVGLADPKNMKTIRAADAEAMLAAVQKALPADIFVGAAAVADWRLAAPSSSKLKKKTEDAKLTLELVPTVDILAAVARGNPRPALVIGFAAETEALIENARLKRRAKGTDWLVANAVNNGEVFGAEENEVILITESGEEKWPQLKKREVADRLVTKIAQHFTTAVKGKTA